MTDQAVEVLRLFYARERQPLYTYAVSITGHRESAEDAVQQAFQQVLRRGRLPTELRPYVFRCVRNSALDAMRRDGVRRDSIFAPEASDENPASYPKPGADLATLLAGLTAEEREAIVLKLHTGFTFHEISSLRGVPLATVASWYRRGLEKMRTLIATAPHERP